MNNAATKNQRKILTDRISHLEASLRDATTRQYGPACAKAIREELRSWRRELKRVGG